MSEINAPRKRRRVEFIDATRGIAALLVLLQHYLANYAPSTITVGSDYVFNPGRIGVIAFFLVSGYIIPFSISGRKSVGDFLTNRIFRLYPVYWLSLLAHLAMWLLGYKLVQAANFHSIWHWIANFSMFQMYLRVPDISAVSWTLGIEWIIYITVSFWIFKKFAINFDRFIKLALICLLILSIALPLIVHKRVPGALVTCLLASLCGLVWFKRDEGEFTLQRAQIYSVLIITLNALAIYVNYGLFTKDVGPESNWILLTINSLAGYGVFLAFYLARNKAFPKILIWLGSISYALYLFHGLVPSIFKPYFSNTWVMLSVATVASLLFSHLVHVLVEKPLIKFGKSISRRSQPSP